jgi:endonuclease/exonuclease/phosphatase family metal-dependent hydrolase
MRSHPLVSNVALILILTSAAGCTEGGNADDADPLDSEDASFEIGKADGACLSDTISDDSRGVLALANDPAVTEDELDDNGLHWRTAAEIVAARPIADLAALDAVPTVGPRACLALRAYACTIRGFCERELPLWTWNIEHFPLSASTVASVAATMTELGAEMVGFQEVDSLPAFDQLLANLPGWEGLPGQTGFDTQVAIAYRTDRLRLISTEDLFLDDSWRFPRPPVAVTFEVKGRVGVRQLTVVVVHLKAQVDATSEQRRRLAILDLAAWMDARRSSEAPVIAVGDWNDDINDSGSANVFSPLLDPSRYAALTLPAANRGEYSYIPFRRLIDHQIATVEATAAFQPLVVDVIALDQTIPGYLNTVSDHRPVRARLVPIIPRN